jgi:isoleucyl-tRNA synthetase
LKILTFALSIKEKDKMSTKFTEYKGLDLPTVASEVLDFGRKKHILKSITTREGNPPFVFSRDLRQTVYGNSPCYGTAIKDIFCRYKTQKGFQ